MAKKIQPKKIIKRAQRQQQQQKTQAEAGPQYEVPAGEYIEGIGRRKVATARVRIYQTKDKNKKIVVNDQLAQDYFQSLPLAIKTLTQPFELTGTKDQFAVTAKVEGSGLSAQLDAIVHGLSRALISHDPAFRTLLKQEGLLTRDARMKETRKPGRGGKARRKRQSPKR